MKELIVYSLYLREGFQTQAWLELLYSLKTLRQVSTLPVIVYIASGEIDNEKVNEELSKFTAVEIRYFINDVRSKYGSTYISEGFGQLLDHRWKNALDVFDIENNPAREAPARILYLDADTIFHSDPRELFKRYTDPNVLYARLDLTPDISQPIGLEYGMNDGQFILSREVAEKLLPNFYENQQEEIYQLLTRTKTILSAEKHRHLHWLSVQYTVLKMLQDRGVPVKEFDKRYVKLSTEPSHIHQPQGCTPRFILHHYFSGNLHRYLPKEYWNEHNKQKYTAVNLTYCSCGAIL